MNRKKSICYNALFINNYLGGIGNICFQLCKYISLQHPEINITLLIPKYVVSYFSELRDRISIIEIPYDNREIRLFYFHLIFPFKAKKFDLIHSVGNMGLIFSSVKQIITITDTYEHVSPERFGWLKRKFMSFIISHSGRKASRILTISENSKRDIGKYYKHLHSKVSVIYLGSKFPVRKECSSQKRNNFVFVGTIEPGKNLAHVLEAFAQFIKSYNQRLLIVGAKGWKQSNIPQLLDGLNIKDRVDFLGYVSDHQLGQIYKNSLALIQASSYEGFGLPVIEAMACGCLTIVARNSSLIEAGGNAAFFFNTGDVNELCLKMKDIYTNEEKRKEQREAGYTHAAQFTWEETAKRTYCSYQEILSWLS